MMTRVRLVLLTLAILLAGSHAHAQWSSNTAAGIFYPGNVSVAGNLEVADAAPGAAELSRNGVDWTGSSGLANEWQTWYWNASGGSITFATSTVTGNGFTGNAQRVVYQTVSGTTGGKLYQPILFLKDHQYKISFRYRSYTTLQVVLGDNEAGMVLPPNTGNAIAVTLLASPLIQDRPNLDFYAPGGGVTSVAGTWFEIDDVSVKETTAGNVMVRGLVTGGGAKGLKVGLDGNVGIGIPNPAVQLHVVGSGYSTIAAGRRTDLPSISSLIALDSTSGAWSLQNSSGDLIFFAGGTLGTSTGTERLRLATSGQAVVGGTWAGVQSTDRLAVNGDARFSGTVRGGNIQANYQDVAEWVPASESMSPGMVVVVDDDSHNTVTVSTRPYDTRVAGVVSARPGLLLGIEGPGQEMIATTGRVKVRVDASQAAIHAGDLLVTGRKPGVAMRSEPIEVGGAKIHRPGTLIGKALEPLAQGEAEILVLLSLQ